MSARRRLPQTLYNRHWDSDDRRLAPLFEFGLGAGQPTPAPWAEHFGQEEAEPYLRARES